MKRFALFAAVALAVGSTFAATAAAEHGNGHGNGNGNGHGHGVVVLTTTMTGAQEAPGPGDPHGSGTAVITLTPGGDQICWSLQVADLTSPAVAAHIHVGAVGEPGPVVVPLTPPDASGTSQGCTTVDPALVDAIIANPANYYVNVHTVDFPAGAIRGQLG